MKYLVMNGSPHKGNTWSVTQTVVKRIAETNKDSTFEEIQLIEQNLGFCLGCSNCFRKGPGYCPHKEIMSVLLQKMNDADGVIVATTTFNCRETALLKNFLDHLNYLLHRPQFFTGKALVITTVGGVGGKATLKSVMPTLRGMGFNKCYGICIQSVSWNAYQIRDKDRKKINSIADHFAKDVASKKLHFPSSLVLIPYNIFRGVSGNFTQGNEYATEDGSYYENKKGIYDARVPLLPHQLLIGKFFYLLGKGMKKNMIVTYKK